MISQNIVRLLTAGTVVIAVVCHHQARGQGERRGAGRTMFRPFTIIALPAVQKELALKPEQADKAKALARDVQDELREEMASSGIDFQAMRDLSPAERSKKMEEYSTKMAEVNRKTNARFAPKLNEILDKAQQKRLHEIAIQAAGASALEDSDVAKDLDLTKEQQDKIKKIGKDFEHKIAEAREIRGGRSEIAAKMVELREEENAKSIEVLTKEQQAKFAEMKGKPFDTRSLFQRRARRAE